MTPDGPVLVQRLGARAQAPLPHHQHSAAARTAAGCSAVKLHDLRHFYASGLFAAGCDVVTVQRALGHASASVTLNPGFPERRRAVG